MPLSNRGKALGILWFAAHLAFLVALMALIVAIVSPIFNFDPLSLTGSGIAIALITGSVVLEIVYLFVTENKLSPFMRLYIYPILFSLFITEAILKDLLLWLRRSMTLAEIITAAPIHTRVQWISSDVRYEAYEAERRYVEPLVSFRMH